MTLTYHLSRRAVAEIFAKASSVVLLVAAARVLRADTFGEFSLAWAAGWIAATSTDLGVHLVTAREIAQDKDNAAAWTRAAFAAKSALTCLVAVALIIVVPTLAAGPSWPLLCVAGAVVAMSYVDLAQHVLRARGAFDRDAIVQVFARGLVLAGGLAGVAVWGLPGLAVAMLVAALIGAIAAMWSAFAGERRGRARVATPLVLKLAIPVGLGMLLSIVCFRVDLFLLEALRGSWTVGIYAAGYRVFEAAQLVPAIVVAVLFPRLATIPGASAEGRQLRARWLAALAVSGSVVALAGILAGPAVIAAIFGSGYEQASTPLRILLVATPILYANYLMTQDLIASGRHVWFAVLSGCALAVNVWGNLVAIPRFSMAGAAAVTVLTEAVLAVGCFVVLRTVRPSSDGRLSEGIA